MMRLHNQGSQYCERFDEVQLTSGKKRDDKEQGGQSSGRTRIRIGVFKEVKRTKHDKIVNNVTVK